MGKQMYNLLKRVDWVKVWGIISIMIVAAGLTFVMGCQMQKPTQHSYNITINDSSTIIAGSEVSNSSLTSKPTTTTSQTAKPQLEQKQDKSDGSLMIVVIISIIAIISAIGIWLYGRKKGWF